jgi:dTDP-4-amino-4,6-dideoxygalactose transaminase
VTDDIRLLDLQSQRRRLGGAIESAIDAVLLSDAFIMGPEVGQLENELALYCGARNVVSCANGTDALVLVMMAEGVGPGDAVIVPSFTFVATAEAVALRGATPIFCDVNAETFNIDFESVQRAIAFAKAIGLAPKGIIAVDLFGLPADYDGLRSLARTHGLFTAADAAQSFGGAIGSQMVGTLADYTTTSFFPSKPLGCYGDGGAILTDDDERAAVLRSLRVHGRGVDKYDNVVIGVNSRLDTLQAAVLRVKLRILDDEIAERNQLAAGYEAELSPGVACPQVATDRRSAWAQYTVKCSSSEQRALIQDVCARAHVPTAIYYPAPLHLQPGYRHFPVDPQGLARSEKLSQSVLSLPMHPYVSSAQQERVITAVNGALGNGKAAC